MSCQSRRCGRRETGSPTTRQAETDWTQSGADHPNLGARCTHCNEPAGWERAPSRRARVLGRRCKHLCPSPSHEQGWSSSEGEPDDQPRSLRASDITACSKLAPACLAGNCRSLARGLSLAQAATRLGDRRQTMRHLTTSLDNAGGAGQAIASDIFGAPDRAPGPNVALAGRRGMPARDRGAAEPVATPARREQRAILTTLGVSSLAEARVVWWGSRAGAREDLRLAATALIPSRPPATPTAA